MKLLIILTLISSVYCGIRNNITVVDNNTLYLAHTHNCAIYKIDINTSTPEIVVGNTNYFGELNYGDVKTPHNYPTIVSKRLFNQIHT